MRTSQGRLATVAVAAVAAAGLVGTVTQPASATTPNPAPNAGERRSATRLNFPVSDTAALSVDVGTGNALLTERLFTLPGATAPVRLTLAYNSSLWGGSAPSSATGDTGSGWALSGFDQRLTANADSSISYYGPNGLTGVFPSAGGTAYTTPDQFRATLVKTASGWTLTDHESQDKLAFDTDGKLATSTDRSGNATTYSYDPYSGAPVKVTVAAGTTTLETVTATVTAGRLTTLTETAGSVSRSVSLGYTAAGHLGTITDTAGGITKVASSSGTDTGRVVVITNPAGMQTTIGYASDQKVTQVSQTNGVAGGAGTSTTRLTYPSGTQTLVADPATDQAQAVAAVPHSTFNLTSAQRVTSTVDPDGHPRSRTYTPLQDVASATPGAGGATTFGHTANGGESLTSVGSPTGATQSQAYANTGLAQYLPSSATDDAGNASVYTYDTAGRQLTTAVAAGPQAKVTYNSDGTPATSQSPGAAAGVQTTYSYTGHRLSSITPPTGTSLGARAYTWDGYGRLKTAGDGRGNTTAYTYDDLDRITLVDYSDAGTHDVSYTYDLAGRPKQRIDGSGTTNWGWDTLGNLLNTSNTNGGGVTTYTYDKAGAVLTEVDGRGTSTYGYDAAHQLTSITYPHGSGTAVLRFASDNEGRRTDSWLQANAAHTTWAAHTHSDYDSSGRVTRAYAETGPATTPATVTDVSYCYSAGSVAPACGTAAANDRSNIVWSKDAVSGQTTTYTYSTAGRLTKAVLAGGTDPRTYTYSYDTPGNRLTAAVTGTSPASQTLTYNAANQITTAGYTYDGAGNLTHDAAGHTYTYNTAGQRVTAVVGGVTTTYTYAGTGSAELVREETPAADDYTYVYGRTARTGLRTVEQTRVLSGGTTNIAYLMNDLEGRPIGLQTSTGTVSLYGDDGRGNPTTLITEAAVVSFQYSYDPYGKPTLVQSSGGNGTGQNPYLFEAGIQDRITGAVKFGQRWYDPTTGAWTQQDTLNAPLDPGNANRYGYVGGNPVNRADPTGQFDLGALATGLGSSIVAGALIVGGVAALTTCETGVGCVAAVASIGGGIAAAGAAYTAYNSV